MNTQTQTQTEIEDIFEECEITIDDVRRMFLDGEFHPTEVVTAIGMFPTAAVHQARYRQIMKLYEDDNSQLDEAVLEKYPDRDIKHWSVRYMTKIFLLFFA